MPDLGANNGGGGLGAPDVGATGAWGGEAGGSIGEVEASGSGDRMDIGDRDSTGRRTEERASLGGRAGAGRGCRREIGRGRRRRVLAAGGDRVEARWKEGPARDPGSRGRRATDREARACAPLWCIVCVVAALRKRTGGGGNERRGARLGLGKQSG
ncbi:hypothetical protein CFC21_097957 [Triticum aestivum]|uniref:Uncharacterized protein n=3 Tax=Triticum TaxID=4564 RepID=A0A9R0ZD34_TRITD|nr:hypothetical protein CFC21_097957 [Triticum aestivum]VAI75400.1 unnamed protein product [Triticum turgidum subsp. durum]